MSEPVKETEIDILFALLQKCFGLAEDCRNCVNANNIDTEHGKIIKIKLREIEEISKKFDKF